MRTGEQEASEGAADTGGQQLVGWLYEELGWSDGRIALEVRKAAVVLGLYPRLDESNRHRPDHVTVYRWRHGRSSPGRFYMRLLHHLVNSRRQDLLGDGTGLLGTRASAWGAGHGLSASSASPDPFPQADPAA